MESDTDQLRTQLAKVQADLASQIELTQGAMASETAMKARLTAEEENNAQLKAALDMQTQVSFFFSTALPLCALMPLFLELFWCGMSAERHAA